MGHHKERYELHSQLAYPCTVWPFKGLEILLSLLRVGGIPRPSLPLYPWAWYVETPTPADNKPRYPRKFFRRYRMHPVAADHEIEEHRSPCRPPHYKIAGKRSHYDAGAVPSPCV